MTCKAPIYFILSFNKIYKNKVAATYRGIMSENDRRDGEHSIPLDSKQSDETKCFETWFRERSIFCSEKICLRETPDKGEYRGVCKFLVLVL